jgi:hypothetical protein
MTTIKFFRIIVCALLGVATVAFAQENVPAAGGSAVNVLIAARGQGGEFLQDLKPEEITALDNGHSAKVLAIGRAANQPLRLGILLVADQTVFKAQQQAAIQVLQGLRPGIDQAFVLTQATSTTHRAWPNPKLIWNPDPKTLISFVQSLHWDDAVDSGKDIVMGMLKLNPDRRFRRVMLEFRDPEMEVNVDYRSMAFKELDALLMMEISEYQRLGAVVYACPVKSLLPLHYNFVKGSIQVERLADATGGRHLLWSDNLNSEMAEFQKELQNQLLLTFMSHPDNHPHTLQVRANRKDVRIVASPKQFYP